MAILSQRSSITFTVAAAAGSGILVQATYTVPNGKRARLVHSQLEIAANGGAAGTLVGPFVTIITNATGRTHRVQGAGIANALYSAQDSDIVLASGDQVTLSSHNTSAVIVTQTGTVFFEEFL